MFLIIIDSYKMMFFDFNQVLIELKIERKERK
jgi:hypothetical protein